VFSLSLPAKAGNPVFQSDKFQPRGLGVLDRPVKPGDDTEWLFDS
jgi:hypothetical protein